MDRSREPRISYTAEGAAREAGPPLHQLDRHDAGPVAPQVPRSQARIASSDMTPAVMGRHRCPPATTPSSSWDAMLSRSSTPRARGRHISAASRWAASPAMWLGVHAPDRVASLVLANTGARIGTLQSWTARSRWCRSAGCAGWPTWRCRSGSLLTSVRTRPEIVARFKSMVEDCPDDGYLGCCAALRDEDLREAISITCPVLAVAGLIDVPTPPEALRFVHERIAGSKMLTLDAAHLSNVEQAEAFTSAVMGFWGVSDQCLLAIPTPRNISDAVLSRKPTPARLGVDVEAGLSSPCTLTVIVSQRPAIVACLSSPACTASLCIPGESCMSIGSSRRRNAPRGWPVESPSPAAGSRCQRRDGNGRCSDALCFCDFAPRHRRDGHLLAAEHQTNRALDGRAVGRLHEKHFPAARVRTVILGGRSRRGRPRAPVPDSGELPPQAAAVRANAARTGMASTRENMETPFGTSRINWRDYNPDSGSGLRALKGGGGGERDERGGGVGWGGEGGREGVGGDGEWWEGEERRGRGKEGEAEGESWGGGG